MDEDEISGIIIDACYHIHVHLGSGLLESVYEEILCYELRDYMLKDKNRFQFCGKKSNSIWVLEQI